MVETKKTKKYLRANEALDKLNAYDGARQNFDDACAKLLMSPSDVSHAYEVQRYAQRVREARAVLVTSIKRIEPETVSGAMDEFSEILEPLAERAPEPKQSKKKPTRK